MLYFIYLPSVSRVPPWSPPHCEHRRTPPPAPPGCTTRRLWSALLWQLSLHRGRISLTVSRGPHWPPWLWGWNRNMFVFSVERFRGWMSARWGGIQTWNQHQLTVTRGALTTNNNLYWREIVNNFSRLFLLLSQPNNFPVTLISFRQYWVGDTCWCWQGQCWQMVLRKYTLGWVSAWPGTQSVE